MPWLCPRQGEDGAWGAWSHRSGTPIVSTKELHDSTILMYLADQKGTPVHGHGGLSTAYLVKAAHDPEVVGQDANLCMSTHFACHHQVGPAS